MSRAQGKSIMCKNPGRGAHRRLLGLIGNQEGPGERVGAAEGKAAGLVEATVCVFSTNARDPTFYSEDSSGV